MKRYLIFDLDGTLIISNSQIDTLIYTYIKNHFDSDIQENARYYIENFQWMSLQELFNRILDNKNQAKFHRDTLTKKIDALQNQVQFFDWACELIEKLSKEYILFLSTWNSDNFAKEILKKWNIYHYFEKVLGSTNIMKSSEHLEEFYKHIQDENFYKNATFIWDWARDREIAGSKNLNFIHIGNQWKDKYEISEIKYIETILPFIK